MKTMLRMILLASSLALLTGVVGCAPKDDMVDAPLKKASGPPPPRPDKPTLSPGAPGAGQAGK